MAATNKLHLSINRPRKGPFIIRITLDHEGPAFWTLKLNGKQCENVQPRR